jgi:hypothetical protein
VPYVGFYRFDVAASVSESTLSVPDNTSSAQQLTVKGSGGDSIAADVSGTYDPGVGGSTKFVNTHLQGSGFIQVVDDEGDKQILVNVTLPNGADQAILGGYLHVEYVGEYVDV